MGGRGSSSNKGGSSSGAMKIPLSRIKINKNEYIFWHGERPSGFADWAFDIGGETVFIHGKFSEASKKAKKIAQTKGYSRIQLLT